VRAWLDAESERGLIVFDSVYQVLGDDLRALVDAVQVTALATQEALSAQIIDDANRYQYLKEYAFNTWRQGYDGRYIRWRLDIPAANEPNDSLDAAISSHRRYLDWKEPYPAKQKI